jgi:hypothetical protein
VARASAEATLERPLSDLDLVFGGQAFFAGEDLLGDRATAFRAAVIDDAEVPPELGAAIELPLELPQFAPQEVLAELVFGPAENTLVLFVDDEHDRGVARTAQALQPGLGARELHRHLGTQRRFGSSAKQMLLEFVEEPLVPTPIEQAVGRGVHLFEVIAVCEIQLCGRRAAQFIGDCVEGSVHARVGAIA